MNRNFEQFLLNQRLESMSENAGITFFAVSGGVIATIYILRNNFDFIDLFCWAAVAILIAGVVYLWKMSIRKKEISLSKLIWLKGILLLNFAAGFTFGNIPLLFFVPDDSKYLVFIFCIFAGYLSGSLSISLAHHSTFKAYVIGISCPIIIRLLMEGGDLHMTITGFILFYVAILLYISNNLEKLYVKSVQSQFENLLLIDQLADEKKTVEHAVATKDQFLAAASHDLRQPLNAANVYMDVLRPMQVSRQAEEVVDRVKVSLKALNGMLHGLLDISRLDAGVVKNDPQHLSLYIGVGQLVEEYRSNAEHITIESQVSPDHIVVIDSVLLTRIVRNLLDNAVKYTPNGSVKILSEAFESFVRLSVIDTGIGIDKEQIDTVFDEFQQINNPERNRDKGLGLGLAIVKRLCRLAGINLELNSVVGKGTIISIDMARGDVNLVKAEPTRTELDLDGYLVVIIDDETDIVDSTKMLLEGWGCRTIATTSIDETFSILSQQEDAPNVVISDLRLEGERTGIDAIEVIREEYNLDIPAILITGDTASDRIELANSVDCVVMYKPIDGQELKEQMKLLLSR